MEFGTVVEPIYVVSWIQEDTLLSLDATAAILHHVVENVIENGMLISVKLK